MSAAYWGREVGAKNLTHADIYIWGERDGVRQILMSANARIQNYDILEKQMILKSCSLTFMGAFLSTLIFL